LLQHSRIVISPFGGRFASVNWVIDHVYNALIDLVEPIIGNLASTLIRVLSTVGAVWIIGGDIFMALTLMITWSLCHFIVGSQS
jgi:hypothetical protein